MSPRFRHKGDKAEEQAVTSHEAGRGPQLNFGVPKCRRREARLMLPAHSLLEFFEPVEDNVDLAGERKIVTNHEEALAVRKDLVGGLRIRAEKLGWITSGERRLQCDRHRNHLVSLPVEKFAPIR